MKGKLSPVLVRVISVIIGMAILSILILYVIMPMVGMPVEFEANLGQIGTEWSLH